MPRCSHDVPFEFRCDRCFQEALAREGVSPLQAPHPIPMRQSYPVEVALAQQRQPVVAYRTVLDPDLKGKV